MKHLNDILETSILGDIDKSINSGDDFIGVINNLTEVDRINRRIYNHNDFFPVNSKKLNNVYNKDLFGKTINVGDIVLFAIHPNSSGCCILPGVVVDIKKIKSNSLYIATDKNFDTSKIYKAHEVENCIRASAGAVIKVDSNYIKNMYK